MDRLLFEHAVTQVLENYQRCGLTRFGSLAMDDCSAEMLAAVANLSFAQEMRRYPADQVTAAPGSERGAGAPLAPAEPVAISPPPFSTDLSSPLATRPQDADHEWERSSSKEAAAAFDRKSTKRSDEIIPLSGMAAQPWSLPVLPSEERDKQLGWLAGKVRDCRQCSAIVSYRQQTVFGSGPLSPRLCFMGEAPGADEDRTGQPFVGKAGQLLTKIISAMKLNRDDVYILNALKCRPPQNRTPLNEEIDSCRHFVESQLDLLQPEFIVCLGAVAVRSILRSELPIGRLRGQFYNYRSARVVVTYHPSYLLRNESAKRMVWDDMKMLMAELGELGET